MSNKALNAVWSHSKAKGNQRLVLLSIADQADDHGWAWPKINPNIMKRTLLARRTVQRAIQRLQETDQLAIVRRVGTSNLYRVTVGELAEGHHPAPKHIQQWFEARKLEEAERGVNLTRQTGTEGPVEGRQSDTARRDSRRHVDVSPETRSRATQEAREPLVTHIEPPREPSVVPSTVVDEAAEEDPHGNSTGYIVVVDQSDGWPTEVIEAEVEEDAAENPALAVVASEDEAEIRTEIFGACDRPLCDRGHGHKGPHRDLWYEAVGIALQQKISKRLQSRAGQLARQVEEEGLPPEEIPRRAAVLLAKWGPDKLTINSLREHWDWAGSPLREISEADIRRHVEEMNRADRIRRLQGGTPPPALPSMDDPPERGTA